MATFKLAPNTGLTFNFYPDSFDFGFLEDQGSVISHNTRKFVVSQSTAGWTFTGHDFGGYDGHGWPTTGVIESLSATGQGQDILGVTGLSVEVADFRYLAETNDSLGFYNLFFGGDDVMTGAEGYDSIYGIGGDDVLRGMEGPDRLVGGEGADTLIGGRGKDRFVIEAQSASTPLASDLILDLHDNDKIDIKFVDASHFDAEDQAFTIVAAFTHAAAQLVVSYDSGTDRTTWAGDTDGDGVADMMFQAVGDHTTFDNLIL